MKLGYWKGFNDGEKQGRLQALQDFERVLAILREELADARTLSGSQAHRADAAVDLLLGHLGTRAISLEGERREVERSDRHIKAVQQLTAIPDPTDDLPYGHPLGTFGSEKEARLDFGADIPEEITT